MNDKIKQKLDFKWLAENPLNDKMIQKLGFKWLAENLWMTIGDQLEKPLS